MSDAIDWVHLERQTMGETEIAKDVLGMFVEHLDEALAGFSSGDPDLPDKVHKLKGSARGVGAWELADIADRFAGSQLDIDADLALLKQAMTLARQTALEKMSHF